MFDGLGMNLGNLPLLSRAKTRSISAENPKGAKGKGAMAKPDETSAAADLGQGWKVRPCITLEAGGTTPIAEIKGPGVGQHIWITVHPQWWRRIVLRMYWDGERKPSVETPLGDFFCMGWCERANITSLAVCVNPAGGFNTYFPMPFRKSARITVENLSKEDIHGFFYQVTYALTDVPADAGYLHAQWRRSNPLPYEQVHTILDGVKGLGHYAGTYLAWGVNNCGWWGEGEIKFYMDGDDKFPTICGTGTEDYFCGAWDFEQPKGEYCVFSTPYAGLPQVIIPDGLYRSQQRFGMYRWHIMDPIRFEKDLKIDIQALGWRNREGDRRRFLPLQDDISSTAYWYQREPHVAFPKLPDRDYLEVI
ncbi:MAG: glycoside hydrolase family 172 protein [Planctomycetota bacterium]|jgi:hypothetical protein